MSSLWLSLVRRNYLHKKPVIVAGLCLGPLSLRTWLACTRHSTSLPMKVREFVFAGLIEARKHLAAAL